MLRVDLLYPQYKVIKDRRQEQTPVAFERRSGVERRSQDRVALDTSLTKDIFEIRSKMSQAQSSSPVNNSQKVAFTQNSANAVLTSLKKDEFQRTTDKEVNKPSPKAVSKMDSAAPLALGILGCTLGGIIASSFMGPAGAVVAVGAGVYLGGKLVKQVVEAHLQDKNVK